MKGPGYCQIVYGQLAVKLLSYAGITRIRSRGSKNFIAFFSQSGSRTPLVVNHLIFFSTGLKLSYEGIFCNSLIGINVLTLLPCMLKYNVKKITAKQF